MPLHLLRLFIILLCLSTRASLFAQKGNNNTAENFNQKLGEHWIEIYSNPLRIEIHDKKKIRALLKTTGPIKIIERKQSNIRYKKPYYFYFGGMIISEEKLTAVTHVFNTDSCRYFILGNRQTDSAAVMKLKYDPEGILDLNIQRLPILPASEAQHFQIEIPFESDTTDSYLGMGMRFNKVNHYGTKVTHWASEVGTNLPQVSDNRTPEGRDITYAPVPFFLNLRGYGFFLRGTHYSEFDFAKTNEEELRVRYFSDHANMRVFLNDNPLEIISTYYNSTGRYTLPKPWVFGVWAAAGSDWQSKEKGQSVNYGVMNICRQNNIPCSAIWAEDWYFDFFSSKPIEDWTINRKYYPQYEEMIKEHHRMGYKHLGYFLPYIGKMKLFKLNKNFRDADTLGLLTKDFRDKSAIFKFFVWNSAQVDFSNPRASEWFQRKFYAVYEKKGVDGWMNDFGEYTPYQSLSYNGEYGSSMHNHYPLLWAKAAQDFFSKARPDGDYCLFSRSGAAGLHRYNAFIFTGDRNANYDKLSGVGGCITGVLNGSMSVHPNVSIDIGAYNCHKTSPMNKLMMFRSIEMGALLPVMRLHRGVQLCDHWRFDEDEETLMQWKKYARLHAKLFPYIYTLAKEAADKGLPMVRHLSLQYPGDKPCLKQDFQFLLGDRILSCPVIEEDNDRKREDMTKSRQQSEVYLPPGIWYHYWSGKRYEGGRSYTVDAAPGYLPMFISAGKIIPTFNREVDTFVEGVENPDIKDFEEVNQSVEILFYGYGEDEMQLWDGTVISCSRKLGQAGTYAVKNGGSRSYSCVFAD